jgi:hypothetical protein
MIINTTRHALKDGKTKGVITVCTDGRKYSVKYEREPNGHAEQWGAPTEILCEAYPTFERLCLS